MNTELLKSKLLEAAFNGFLTHADTSKWKETTVGEVADVKGGKRIPAGTSVQKEPTSHMYIRVTDMKNHTIVDDDIRYITDELHEGIKRYTISKDDLYLTIAGSIGRVGIVPAKFDGMNLTENAVKLTNLKVEKLYLMYFLASYGVQRQIQMLIHQMAQPKLSIINIKSIPIQYPDIEEQRNIVSTIEEGFAAIDVIAAAKENLSTTSEMLRSKILQSAFDGTLTGADVSTWKYTKLGELVDIISGTSYEKSDVQEDGIRVLRGGNIQNDVLVLDDDDVFVPTKYRDTAKCIKKGDTIIVASTGSQKAIGKPALIKEDYEDVQIGAFLRIVRPKDIQFAPYIQCFFLSPLYREYIRMQAKGTNINNIKNKYLTDLLLPLPPLAEQQRIVAKIEELFAEIDKLGQ